MTYEFTKEQRDTISSLIKGELSFRGAMSILDISASGVYSMAINLFKTLWHEGKIKF